MENQQYMYSSTFIDNRNSENTTTKRHGHAERKMHTVTRSTSATLDCGYLSDGHAKNCYTHASVDERQDCKHGEARLALQLSSLSARSICGGLWVSSAQHQLPPRRCRRVPPPFLALPPPFSCSSSHAWMRLRTIRFGASWSMRKA